MAQQGPQITLGRIFRFIVFILTSGYLYPHVCTEGMNINAYEKEELAKSDAK